MPETPFHPTHLTLAKSSPPFVKVLNFVFEAVEEEGLLGPAEMETIFSEMEILIQNKWRG